MLFLGDVAQHPDLPALEDLLAEGPGLVGERRIAGQRMAAEGERPRLAAYPQRQQLATGLAVATGVRQPAWLEVRQQAQQVMLAGLGRTDAEEAFGLGIEVAEAAVGAGHQHPLVDRRQGRGRLAQAALRGQGHGAQALLLAVQAQQHVHGDADQQEEDRQLAADSRQQAEPHSRAVVEPAKLPVAVAQRFHAEGLHVVEQRRAPGVCQSTRPAYWSSRRQSRLPVGRSGLHWARLSLARCNSQKPLSRRLPGSRRVR